MSDEQLLKLIKVRPNGIIHQLMVNGLVELVNDKDGLTLENIKPSKLAESILGVRLYFTDEWFNDLKKMWPPELRGNSKIIKTTCQNFIEKHKVSLDVVRGIVAYWLQKHDKPYCGKMENFFMMIKDGEPVSRAEELLDIDDAVDTREDYRLQQV